MNDKVVHIQRIELDAELAAALVRLPAIRVSIAGTSSSTGFETG